MLAHVRGREAHATKPDPLCGKRRSYNPARVTVNALREHLLACSALAAIPRSDARHAASVQATSPRPRYGDGETVQAGPVSRAPRPAQLASADRLPHRIL